MTVTSRDLQNQIDRINTELRTVLSRIDMIHKRIDTVEHLATARDNEIEQRLKDLETAE